MGTKIGRAVGPDKEPVGEHRLPAVIAVLVGVALYIGLPSELVRGPRFVVPALELLLLVPLVIVNPSRFRKQTAWSRTISLALVAVIGATNLLSLGLLVDSLLNETADDGKRILLAALQVWLTNVIVFGLAYWELDRGGPVKRSHLPHKQLPHADFRFAHDENAATVDEVAATASSKSTWRPTLVDYLYVSVTNSSAFSPTDTMPLSTRAKLMMSVQSTAALIISLLVISKAVSALG